MKVKARKLDLGMEASEWVPLSAVDGLEKVRPSRLKALLKDWENVTAPRFLGTTYIEESAPAGVQ